MFERILVVCTGNICRSPLAEAMLKVELPDRTVTSAGLAARSGEPADLPARELARANNLDLEAHVARALKRDMVAQADLILVMTEDHRRAIGALVPEALGKTLLLGRWLPAGSGGEIPDPYRKSQDAYAHVYELIRAAVVAWARRL